MSDINIYEDSYSLVAQRRGPSMVPEEIRQIFREEATFMSCEKIGEMLIRKKWEWLSSASWRLKDGERNGCLGKGVGMSRQSLFLDCAVICSRQLRNIRKILYPMTLGTIPSLSKTSGILFIYFCRVPGVEWSSSLPRSPLWLGTSVG